MLAAAKKKKGISLEGCNLSFYKDMSKEGSAQCKLFSLVIKAFWQHQVKPTLPHPATLRFTWRGARLRFVDAQEAVRFVREKIDKARKEGTEGEHLEADWNANDGLDPLA